MNPYMQAVKFYENREDFPFFGEALHQILMNGFVHSTPDFFIMATPVNKDELTEDVFDVYKNWPKEEQNCWMVWFAAGKIDGGFEICPYQLPYVCFRRENILRVYGFRNIKRVVELIQE